MIVLCVKAGFDASVNVKYYVFNIVDSYCYIIDNVGDLTARNIYKFNEVL